MIKKLLLTGLLLTIVCGGSAWYYIFLYSKTHHRDVTSETALVVSAHKIVQDYETNEKSANALYLNKAIDVRGAILSEKKDQSGNITLTLKSGDAFSNVFCTLKPGASLGKDSVVEVKGFCTGFLSDVVLNDAIIVKPRMAAR